MLDLAAQGVARAIIQQEGSLCTPRKNASPLAQPGELVRLREVLDEFMPTTTEKDIVYSRTDNICMGTGTDDSSVPQESAEDSFLAAKGTPPAGSAQGNSDAFSGPQKARAGRRVAAKQAASLNAELAARKAQLEQLKKQMAELQLRQATQAALTPLDSSKGAPGTGPNPPQTKSSPGQPAASDDKPQAGASIKGSAKQPRLPATVSSGNLADMGGRSSAAADAVPPVSDEGPRQRTASLPRESAELLIAVNASTGASVLGAQIRAAGKDSGVLVHPIMSLCSRDSGGKIAEPQGMPGTAGKTAQPGNPHGGNAQGNVCASDQAAQAPISSRSVGDAKLSAADETLKRARESPERLAAEGHREKLARTSQDRSELAPTEEEASGQLQHSSALQGPAASSTAAEVWAAHQQPSLNQPAERAGDWTSACSTGKVRGLAAAPGQGSSEQQLQAVQRLQQKRLHGQAKKKAVPPFHDQAALTPPAVPPVDPWAVHRAKIGAVPQPRPPVTTVYPAVLPSVGSLVAAPPCQQDVEMRDVVEDEDVVMQDAPVGKVAEKLHQPSAQTPQPLSYRTVLLSKAAQNVAEVHRAAQSQPETQPVMSGNPFAPGAQKSTQKISGGDTQLGAPVSWESRPPPGWNWLDEQEAAAGGQGSSQEQRLAAGVPGSQQGQRSVTQEVSYSQAVQKRKPQANRGANTGSLSKAGTPLEGIGKGGYKT